MPTSSPTPPSTTTATATTSPTPTHAATSTSTGPFDEEAFLDALSDEIDRKRIIPDFVTIEISPMFIKEPSIAFKENNGIVLQLKIFGYPDPKKTIDLVAPFAEVITDVADRYGVSLTGIEFVYHRRQDNSPMLVWAITPPWEAEQIFATPP